MEDLDRDKEHQTIEDRELSRGDGAIKIAGYAEQDLQTNDRGETKQWNKEWTELNLYSRAGGLSRRPDEK